jgi:hypothetical protein
LFTIASSAFLPNSIECCCSLLFYAIPDGLWAILFFHYLRTTAIIFTTKVIKETKQREPWEPAGVIIDQKFIVTQI